MRLSLRIVSIASFLSGFLHFNDCKAIKNVDKNEQVRGIAPGLLQGYLSKAELSNSLLLIPPPPEEGSIAFSFDQEYANKAVESKDAARFVRATHDEIPYFPEAVESFESTLGIEIFETKTPKLYVLLRSITYAAAVGRVEFKKLLMKFT